MSIKDAPTVPMPQFDEKEAYNPDRAISSLIRTQLLHLHHAEYIVVPEKARTNININTLDTERKASEYIQQVTALLHKYGKKPKPARKKTAAKKSAGKSRKAKPAAKKRASRK